MSLSYEYVDKIDKESTQEAKLEKKWVGRIILEQHLNLLT